MPSWTWFLHRWARNSPVACYILVASKKMALAPFLANNTINRTDVSNCTSCVGVGGCGYCLSTLQCVDGTESGPSDGSPCPSWISEPDVCPGTVDMILQL